MPPQQGQKLAIVQRRQRVSDLYLQGHPLHSIAEQLTVTTTTIWRDLQAIQKEWRESTLRDFDAQIEQQLKKIDLVEREAWLAWERSQKPAQEANVRDSDPSRSTKRMKSRHGDLRCMEVILKCISARREILGLDPHKPSINIQADKVQVVDQSELRRQMLHDQAFVDYCRERAIDAYPISVRPDSEPRTVDPDQAPGPLPRSFQSTPRRGLMILSITTLTVSILKLLPTRPLTKSSCQER